MPMIKMNLKRNIKSTKNTKMKFLKTIITTTIISGALLTGCSTEDVLDTNDISSEEIKLDTTTPTEIATASLDKQVAYTEKHLKIIAKYVSRASKSKSVYTNLLQSIDARTQRFDNTVLARDFFTVSTRNILGIDAKESEELDNSLDAFINIDGTDYLPQLYIPFFDKQLKDLSENNKSSSQPLIITPVQETDGIESFMGYYEDDNQELAESGIMVDEVYASLHPVIVINTEGSDCDGNMHTISCNDPIGNDTSDSSDTNSSISRLFIEDMKVKHHKEAWHNGASEVEYVQIDVNKATGDIVVNQDPNNINDIRIRKFSRKEIRRENNININRNIKNGLSNNQTYVLVIFEKDGFPAVPRTSEPVIIDGVGYELLFQSWQGAYDARKFDIATENLNRDNITSGIEYGTRVL